MLRDSKGKGLAAAFLLALLLGLYFQKFYLYVGFALKPYMFVLAAVMVYFATVGRRREVISRLYAYEYAFLLYCVYAMWRGYFAQDNVLALRITIVLIIGLVLYLFASSLAYGMEEETLLAIVYAASIVFFAASLALYFGGQGSTGEGGITDLGSYRLAGSIDDPNIFGIFVSLIYGISFHKAVSGEKKYLASLLLALACILLTWSRGTIFAVVVFNVLYFAVFRRMRVRSVLVNLLIVSVFAVGVFVWLENAGTDIRTNIEARMQDSSGSERIQIWVDALEVFEDFPFTGVGLNNFREYNAALFGDERLVHNAYIEVIVEEGMAGFLIFMAALLMMVFKRDRSELAKVVKMVLCMQFLMLVFLSGLYNEFIFFTMAIYKAVSLRDEGP